MQVCSFWARKPRGTDPLQSLHVYPQAVAECPDVGEPCGSRPQRERHIRHSTRNLRCTPVLEASVG